MSGWLRVEVWSDVVCPWCYLLKRRLDKALARYERADAVDVIWRSFQLDPLYRPGLREARRSTTFWPGRREVHPPGSGG